MRLEDGLAAPRVKAWSPKTVTLFERAAMDNAKSGSITIKPGTTLEEAIRLKTPDLSDEHRAQLRVSLWGAETSDVVPREKWRRVRLKPGAFVVIDPPVMGGGLRQILSIVVSVAALLVAPYLAGALSLGLTGQGIIAAGLAGLGNVLLNAIIPPRSGLDDDKDSPTYSIQGWKNTVQPGGPIWVTMGEHRVAPPFIVPPYTSIRNGKQYLTAVFIWGVGPIALRDLKIGKRDFGRFKFTKVQHWNVDGETNVWPFTLCPRTVIEDQLDIELLNREDGATVDDQAVTAEPTVLKTAPDITEWSFDMYFRQGLVNFSKSDGDKKYKEVSFRIRHRPVTELGDAEPWIVVEADWRFGDDTRQPFWKTYSKTVPTRGQWEVEIYRTFDDDDNNRENSASSLTAFRSIRPEYPINLPDISNIAMTAIELQATNQLQGTIDELNGVVATLIERFNRPTNAYVPRQKTSNPADWNRWAHKSPLRAHPATDDDLKLDEIQAWHDTCRINGFRFDHVYDVETSLWDVFLDTTHAGWAAPRMTAGRWGVSVDEPKDSVKSEPITPHNSWGFEGSRDYKDVPDAFRIKFKDRNDDFNDRERIVKRPEIRDERGALLCEAFTGEPQVLLEFAPVGKTDPAEVYLWGYRRWLEIFLRPNDYKANQDWEALLLQHGDLALLSHDVLHKAHQSGRVVDVDGRIVELEEEVTIEDGKTYGLKFRRSPNGDGASQPQVLTRTVGSTPAGRTRTLRLTGSGDLPEADDIFMFGEIDRLVVEAVVQGIERLDDNGAQIRCKDQAQRIFDIMATVVVPPWSSRVGLPIDAIATVPDAPTVRQVISSRAVYLEGEPVPLVDRRIVFMIDQADTGPAAASFELRHRQLGETVWRTPTLACSASAGVIRYESLYDKGQLIEHQARGKSASGDAGEWGVIGLHEVGFGDPTGPTVSSFSVTVQTDGLIRYDWATSDDAARAKIRVGPATAATYEDLLPLHTGYLTASPYDVRKPTAVGSYKAGIRLQDENGVPGPAALAEFTIGPEELPQQPTALEAQVTGTTVKFSARAENDDHTYRMIFKRGSTSQSYNLATALGAPQRADPGDVRSFTDTGRTSGQTYRYWAASENREGGRCAFPAYIDVSVP